jgi:hypothetical protein
MAAALVAWILLGCAFAQEAATPMPDAPAITDIPEGSGVLQGHVERTGADPRSGAGGTGTAAPVAGDPIEVHDSEGALVAQTVSAQDGSFQLTLPAAVYTVTEDILGLSQPVEVQDQRVTAITFQLAQ